MLTVVHAATDARAAQWQAVDAAAIERREELLRHIETARDAHDVVALVRAVCTAARHALKAEDLPEASWYVMRGLRALSHLTSITHSDDVCWQLCDLALDVSRRWQLRGERGEAWRLQDLLRDASFDMVRQACAVRDPSLREEAVLRAAKVLEELGDFADADGLRQQTRNLGPTVTRPTVTFR